MAKTYGLDQRAAERLGGMLARDRRRRHNPGLPGHVKPLKLGDGGAVAEFVIKAEITAATWSGGVPTEWGTGTGYAIAGLNSVASTGTTIQNKYPDNVTVTSGKAKVVSARQDGNGVWWLIVPNCVEVSAS